ncbi:MAG: hypothetical protein JXB25_13200 [Deltaproteobacteria bacterium]|nr:hypothetical protein [Deltaproteobacteria bacterium]
MVAWIPTKQRSGWLIVFLAVMVILAEWGVAGYFILENRKQTLRFQGDTLAGFSKLVAGQVETVLIQIAIFMKITDAWLQDLPEMDPRQDRRYLETVRILREQNADYIDIRFVSTDGKLYYLGDRPGKPRADVSDREYFRAQLDPRTRGLYVASSVKSRVTGLWGIPVSYPLSQERHGLGVVFAAIELPLIIQSWEQSIPFRSGLVNLIRRDGVLIASAPFQEKLQGFSVVGGDLWQKHLCREDSGTAVLERSVLAHERRIVA